MLCPMHDPIAAEIGALFPNIREIAQCMRVMSKFWQTRMVESLVHAAPRTPIV